jgi:hypothetical protein
MKIFAMTKQVGRASSFSKAVMRGGIDRSVAVDMACARATHRAGLKRRPSRSSPAGCATRGQCRRRAFQPDLLDRFQRNQGWRGSCRSRRRRLCPELAGTHHGRRATPSIAAMKAASTPMTLPLSPMPSMRLKGGRFAGITTFPALLFDHATRKVLPTHNLATLPRQPKRWRNPGATASRSMRRERPLP